MAGNDSFTKALLHFDGTNGSTTITDGNAGGSAHTWTNHTGSIGTGQSKFGGAAYNAGAAVGWVDTPDSADFTLGSGAFTIDCWVYIDSAGNGTQRYIAGQLNAATGDFAWNMAVSSGNVFVAAIGSGGAFSTAIVGTTTYTASGWHHLAFVRTSNTLKMFIDGVQDGGDVTFASTVTDSSSTLAVGRAGAFVSTAWNGFIDEFRLSVGTARWTTTFTPSTAAYGVDYTVSAAVASLVLTGKSAAQAISHLSTRATFALTGQAAALAHNRFLVAAVAAFSLTGKAVTWDRGKFSSVGAFVLTGISATKAVTRATSIAAFTLTGKATTRGIARRTSVATFTLSAIATVLTNIVRPIDKIRKARFVLADLRAVAPTLNNKHIR